MEQTIAQREQSDGIGRIIAFACREPGRACALLLGAHLVVWTVLPILVCRNLQLDLAEGLALGKEWQLGYWKHPPLPWWIEDLAYRAAGDVRVVYLLGPLACVVAFYAVWRLGCRITTPQTALLAVVMLEGLHFFNFTAVKFNHDVLQLPFWALTALFLHRAITERPLLRLDLVRRLAGARVLDQIHGGGAGRADRAPPADRSVRPQDIANRRALPDGRGVRGRDRAATVVADRA